MWRKFVMWWFAFVGSYGLSGLIDHFGNRNLSFGVGFVALFVFAWICRYSIGGFIVGALGMIAMLLITGWHPPSEWIGISSQQEPDAGLGAAGLTAFVLGGIVGWRISRSGAMDRTGFLGI